MKYCNASDYTSRRIGGVWSSATANTLALPEMVVLVRTLAFVAILTAWRSPESDSA